MKPTPTPGLDLALDLDGTTLVVDPHGRHWVKFAVRRVPCSLERPHGLSYSLTLHSSDGQRLIGFDNAHAVTEEGDYHEQRGQSMTTSTKTMRSSITNTPMQKRF